MSGQLPFQKIFHVDECCSYFSYLSDRSKRKHFDTATLSSKYRALNRTLDAIEKISISKRNLLNTVRGNGKCFGHFSSNTPAAAAISC